MSEKRYILGIDVGTSGVKCILIGQDAAVVATHTEGYPCDIPRPGWSEQHPDLWWDGTARALRALLEKSGVSASDIAGIGFSGQMHGLVALDEAMVPIRPAILWNDQRTEAECAEIIAAAGGLDALVNMTNNTMLPGYTGGKLVWVKKHEPDNYAKLKAFVCPKDYIRYKLTGVLATDMSDASGTGLFDVKRRKWSEELIKILGLDLSVFPRAYESDERAGEITAKAAAETGLCEGTPCYAGGGDAVIQTTGMGIVSGVLGMIVGTSGVAAVATNVFAKNEGGKLQYFCGNGAGRYAVFGCQLSSGGSMEWFKNACYDEGDGVFKRINAGANDSPVGANKLLFLPYLTGERCPHTDPAARGAFIGLNPLHERGDMARAVMEGVTFGLREIYDLMRSADKSLSLDYALMSGGGSNSEIWKQIMADMLRLPVKTLKGAAEGGAYGAAVVAGVGSKFWPSLEDAAKKLPIDTVTEPDAENAAKYDSLLKIYQGMYAALKQSFVDLQNW